MLVHAVAEEDDTTRVLRCPDAQVSIRLIRDDGAGEGNCLLGQLVPLNRIAVQLVVEGDRRFA